MQPFRALFVHGVGEQPADFSERARGWLAAELERRRMYLSSQAVHWAPFADRSEQAFLKGVEGLGSKGNPSQRLVVGTLADALMYQSSPTLKSQIFGLLDQKVGQFQGAPFTVFAHSLGCLIVTDWLRARPRVRDVRLVTMASNIGLFTLGQTFRPVPQLLAPGSLARWINVFSRRDMLGFPMHVDPTLSYVKDVEVSLGGIFRGWTGLVHTMYWDDKKLWSETLPQLLEAPKVVQLPGKLLPNPRAQGQGKAA